MKSNNPLILALALAAALSVTACNRNNGGDDAAATTDDMSAAPTPAPVEPAPAPAATMPMDSGMTFAAMDTNSDGGITQDELADTEMLYQHFSLADTDGDGKLSSAEVDAHRASMAANSGS